MHPEDLTQRFSAHCFVDPTGFPLPYRQLAPAGEETVYSPVRLPLVVFLHGAGERGDDNCAQLVNGAAELLAAADRRRDFPCLYIVPQCPSEQRWVEVDWAAKSHRFPAEPSSPLAALLALLDELSSSRQVDPDRIYLIGLSMGGFGVWDLLCRRPHDFAAAVSICGGADEAQAERIAQVPIWVFHGALDPVVSVERSRQMVAALRHTGHRPRYTEYPTVGHDAWWPAWAEKDLLPWLFSQTSDRTGKR